MRRIPSSPLSVHKQQETCYSYTKTESDSDSKPAQAFKQLRLHATKPKKRGETKGARARVRQTFAPLEQLYVKGRCGTAALFFAQLSSTTLLWASKSNSREH
jgi:hypothetical protein